MEGTTIYAFHGRLLRDTFDRNLSDEDAFLLFVLFHSSRVVLSGPVLLDRPGIQEVAADTQRGVSEALASLWGGTTDERAHYMYWYRRWNGEWGSYGHSDNLTAAEQERLEQLRTRLELHPWVRRFEPED